ncbi:MAG: hypothetical protein WC205_04250 [Opitutaceae bacterium]|jgi:hypothetical protein
MSLNVIQLPLEERIKTGCSHAVRLTLAIILAEAAAAGATTSLTLDVGDYIARDLVDRAIFDLVTPFDGGATSELTLAFGYNGVAVDNASAFIGAHSIHADGTEILADQGGTTAVDATVIDATYGAPEQAVLDSVRVTVNELRARRSFAAQETGKLQIVLTSTGANFSALTTGEVVVYFNWIRMTDLRGING